MIAHVIGIPFEEAILPLAPVAGVLVLAVRPFIARLGARLRFARRR